VESGTVGTAVGLGVAVSVAVGCGAEVPVGIDVFVEAGGGVTVFVLGWQAASTIIVNRKILLVSIHITSYPIYK
jgi:hypothetical protein